MGIVVLFVGAAALGVLFGLLVTSGARDWRTAPSSATGWFVSVGSSALLAAIFWGLLALVGAVDDFGIGITGIAGLAAVLYGGQETGVLIAARLRPPDPEG